MLHANFALFPNNKYEDLSTNKLPFNALYKHIKKNKPFDKSITFDEMKNELFSFSKK